MHNNKLVSLLQTFSKTELAHFRKLVNNPYFNDNEVLIRLLDLLIRFLKEEDPPLKKYSKPEIWKKLYPSEAYQDTKYRRAFSDLNKLAAVYLTQEDLGESIPMQIRLLRIFNRAELEKHFKTALQQVSETMEGQLQSTSYYYDMFQIAQQQHVFDEKTNNLINSRLSHLESADYYLECFYLLQKIKHFCEALSYQKLMANQTKSLASIDRIVAHIPESIVQKETVITAYLIVIKLLTNPEQESHYFALKELLADKSDVMDVREVEILYTHLRYYCILQKINNGETQYFEELFQIFKIQLSKKLLLKDGQLAPQSYKNIITVGLRVKAFEWVEHFIREYTDKLPEDAQQNALNYNLSNVYFYQKKYGKVIELLREVEYHNSNYALGSKLLLLRTYYELGEFDALDSLLESFRIYLLRSKQITKETQSQYATIIRMIKKLSSINPTNKIKIKELEKKVIASTNNVAKEWLLEKVEELRTK